ncbi:MAG: hypothetical protein JWR26_431 [Pedosphaera sp.]|nr:hypothetical protein [Pedosphaera sp.]
MEGQGNQGNRNFDRIYRINSNRMGVLAHGHYAHGVLADGHHPHGALFGEKDRRSYGFSRLPSASVGFFACVFFWRCSLGIGTDGQSRGGCSRPRMRDSLRSELGSTDWLPKPLANQWPTPGLSPRSSLGSTESRPTICWIAGAGAGGGLGGHYLGVSGLISEYLGVSRLFRGYVFCVLADCHHGGSDMRGLSFLKREKRCPANGTTPQPFTYKPPGRAGLVVTAYKIAQLEDGQKHAYHDATNDHAQENDEDGLDQCGQAGENGLDFFVQKVGDALEHGVDFAGLLAGGHHADDHAGENRMLGEGGGDAFAAFDVAGGGADGFFHDDVAAGVGDDAHDFEDGNTGADEGGKGAGESREADLMGDVTENGEFDAATVPEFAAGLGLDEVKPAINGAAHGQEDGDDPFLAKGAEGDEGLGGRGQFAAEAGEDFTEHGDDLDQQEDGNADGHDGDHGGIHHGGFDLAAEAGGVFQVGGETAKDFSEETAFFTGADHADVKFVEHFGVFDEGLGEAVAAFNAGADVFDDVFHDLVGGLVGQGLEALDHGETGVDHGGQLAGEDNLVLQGDFAAGGFAFLADFFLDGDDEEIAVEQGRDGGLLGGGFDRVANLASSGGFAGYV